MRQARYGRQPVRTPSPRRVSTQHAVPAPVGGWDAQNPLADMPIDSAVILDNWIPRAGYVELRKGYRAWQTGLSLPVETGMVYPRQGDDEIFAASGGSIFDVSSLDDEPLEVFSGTGSSRFRWINFANDAGTFILADNGSVEPLYYNGLIWQAAAITGTAGVIELDPTTLIDVMEHKSRVYHVQRDSLRVWYLAPNAIQGDANLLDLGPVFDKGGTILCQATWTLDGGAGSDDLAVWITTEGQVAVYQGTNPDDANDWALTGVYDVGYPLSRRSLVKYGSDLVVQTSDGVIPLSQALQLDRAQENLVALTQKIQLAFQKASNLYRNNFGWEGILYQKGTLAIFNIPKTELGTSDQFVQNVQTGAWCRFTGLNAFCWFVANDTMYFGASDGVYQWDVAATDNGNSITADMLTAYNYYGARGANKKFQMIQPVLRISPDLSPAIEIVTDFKDRIPTAVPTVVQSPVSSMWGTSLWGSGLWAASTEIRDGWTGVTGIGYNGGIRMRLTAEAATFFDLAVGDGSLLAPEEGEVLEVTEVARGATGTAEVIAFNVKFENNVGGQL